MFKNKASSIKQRGHIPAWPLVLTVPEETGKIRYMRTVFLAIALTVMNAMVSNARETQDVETNTNLGNGLHYVQQTEHLVGKPFRALAQSW